MEKRLVFDIGMNNGDDTAYYLHRGYRVVAVEADPTLARACETRFQSAIASGDLTIVNKAISEQRGEADFWICDQLSEWNSFDRESATRMGYTAHHVRVPTLPLADLFQEFGVPYFLKVDIEGHDSVAIRDIDPGNAPPLVSMEISSVDNFMLLKSKGYTRFKCVQQGCFKEVVSPRLSLRSALSALLIEAKSSPLANALRQAYRRLRPARSNPVTAGNWSFPPGSSGPFGDEAPGEWRSVDEVIHAWLSRKLGHKLGYHKHSIELSEWFDVHAAR
jgi:FkbM family methyltransferase